MLTVIWMGSVLQTTLKSPVSLVGTGLHSGHPAHLRLLPAAAGHGIWFCRTDVNDRDNYIQASFDNVTDTTLCTRIANVAGTEVSTIEHLMAALAGTGVHNTLIEIDGPEVPIMDGSSVCFVKEIVSAGLQILQAPVRAVRVLKEVSLNYDDVSVLLTPADQLEIDFSIDFSDPVIGVQSNRLTMSNGAFVRELSDCRTFCRHDDVVKMQSVGLALGGSLENAIVVDGDKVLNPEGFRRADECVRHKMLDALGDLALAGAPLLGRYTGMRAGHAATNKLLRKLFATPDAFEIITLSPEQERFLPGANIRDADLSKVA